MVRRKSDVRSNNSSIAGPSKTTNTNVIVPRNRGKRASTRALQEIRYLRKTVKLIIPKSPFSRLVKEIIIDFFPGHDIRRLQPLALEALQEAAEAYIVQFFEDSALLAMHAKRVTLSRNDMILMRRLRGRDDVINR